MKKLKNILTDYWVGTITGASLLAFGLQSLVMNLTTYLPPKLSSDEAFGTDPYNYFAYQLYGSIILVLIGLLFLAVRKKK